MISFIWFVLGSYEVEISGRFMERFLNLCAKQNIVLWNLQPSQNGYKFLVKEKDFKELELVSKKTNTQIKVKKQKGISLSFHKYKSRKSYFIGFLFGILILYLLSIFVWNITVSGLESYSKESILCYIRKYHGNIGTLKAKIDCNNLEEKLREKFPKIAWVSCSLTGTRLKIDVKETIEKNTKQNVKTPCDIVSNKTGNVVSMIIKSGTPLTRTGQNVRKGDTLISGYIYYYSDDFAVTQRDQIKANGKIKLRTKEFFYEKLPKITYEKIYQSSKHRISELKLGSAVLQTTGNKKKKYVDQVEEEKRLKLWGDFYLPCAITVREDKEYKIKKRNRNQGEMKKILEKRITHFREKLKEHNITVMKEKIKIYSEADYMSAKGYFLVEEYVGKIQNIKPLTKKQEKFITPTTATPS